jgi:hypothetical protein
MIAIVDVWMGRNGGSELLKYMPNLVTGDGRQETRTGYGRQKTGIAEKKGKRI